MACITEDVFDVIEAGIVLTCVKKDSSKLLTIGKKYVVKEVWEDTFKVALEGLEGFFPISCFEI